MDTILQDPIQRQALALEILTNAIRKLGTPLPSTKGMGPKDRADRLHAELEKRIKIANAAMKEAIVV